MINHTQFPKFDNDMRVKKGINLDINIPDDDNSENKVERFIDRVLLTVENEINIYNLFFDYDKLSPKQKEAFYEACLEQALYLFAVGDMSLISGYDPINNTVIPVSEIRKRAFSPIAKNLLARYGMLFRGVGTGRERPWEK